MASTHRMQYRCKNQHRLRDIIGAAGRNGIDYLEVSADQLILRVYCANPVTWGPGDTAVITGGARVRGAVILETGAPGESGGAVAIDGDLRVTNVTARGRVITVSVNRPGDFATYTLRLVRSRTDLRPPAEFDLQLSEVDFSFKVDCPSDFDCGPDEACTQPALPEPEINYLAKDYASFRRLMLDRLSVIMPAWQERNAADVQIMLVELLAYVGDHLSYYQDAVATEAYLGTARRRASVRRHARLLDYRMLDGCNARAWVCFEYDGPDPGLLLPEGTQLLTRGAADAPTVAPEEAEAILRGEAPEVFETLHPITLTQARSRILFHTWGDENCCLPAGATRATLVRSPGLVLNVGDVLVFEEAVSPTTGLEADADPGHRCAIRLTQVDDTVVDTLPEPDVALIEVRWDVADALPFALCLSSRASERDERIANVSVARGNVALADHGERVVGEPLGQSGKLEPFRPRLARRPLTLQGRVVDSTRRDRLMVFDPLASASATMKWDARDAQPAISLLAAPALSGADEWLPQADLLASDRFAPEFVVETEEDGSARLRFGDNVLGRKPLEGQAFTATYRVGNGTRGNVGANSITQVVGGNANVRRVWNPLPAAGGLDPESLEQVRQFAPQAFRTQQRAVTPADYIEVSQRRADAQRAAAVVRWTGSWYTTFVTVDRKNGLAVDAPFEEDLRAYLERFRMAGGDLEVTGPVFVPVELALRVCAKDGHFRANVKQALFAAFSSGETGGRLGFFHPDNFTFGQPLCLSQVYQAALAVPGVASVEVVTFRRYGRTAAGELAAGALTVGPQEVIRLDNDRNFPENGKLDIVVEGGL